MGESAADCSVSKRSCALELTFTMGNTDTIAKRLLVLVHDSAFGDLAACSFWLDPSQASATDYTMRLHTTMSWTNASVAFYAADANTPSSHADYHLNNVTLTHRPAGNSAKTECVDPGMPTEGFPTFHTGNLLLDPGFDSPTPPPAEAPFWNIAGGMASQWTNGMVEFHRVPGLPLGIPQHIYQPSAIGSEAGQRFQATFKLGNSSVTRQRVTVMWNGGDGTGMTLGTFWIPPGTPMRQYAMTGFSKTAWPNATFIVEPMTAASQSSTTHRWLQLDDVDFRKTNRAMPGTECWEPGSFTLDTTGFINAEWQTAPAPIPEPAALDAGSAVPGFRGAAPRQARGALSGSKGGSAERALAGQLIQFTTDNEPLTMKEDALAGLPSSDSWLDGLTFHSDGADVSGPAIAPAPARTDPLTVILGGTSSGTVTSSPAGINCSGATVSCTGWFAEGVTVTLTATPDAGLVFVGWAGVCTGTGTCQVTVNGPHSVVAHFASPLQYYHLDVLGSVRMISNAAGAVVKRHDYYAFGEDIAAMTGDPRRFTGKELDPETALHYFGARYYRNLWGRFTSVDPVMNLDDAVVDPQRWNRYAYVGNNPLGFVDPDGREKLSVTITIGIPRSTVQEPVTGRVFSGGPKAQHTVSIETDAMTSSNPELSTSHTIFPTHMMALGPGGDLMVVDTRTGSASSLQERAIRSADGSVSVTASGNPGMPFNGLAPGITYDFTITCSGGSCKVTGGKHDGFPGYVIDVTNEAGKTARIFEYDPRRAGKGPGSLWPPAECSLGPNNPCAAGVVIK